jgi:2-methylcitrate dehydratase
MLGGSREEIINAVSNAWADGEHLRIYRQGNNTGSRKSWAAGDAMARAIWLSLMAIRGEMGYPAVMTAKKWGYYDALYNGQRFKFTQPYESFVIENSVFKFVPAGSQGQTAAECAFKLHPLVTHRLDDIEAINITSHKRMMQIMDKQGPLTNPADRDHCVQYAVAVGLIYGKIETSYFSDEFAADPRIDQLRAKMTVVENPRYSEDVYDPAKRSNPHAIEVRFRDGSKTPNIEVEYPFGHPKRRAEAIPMVEAKFRTHISHRFPQKQQAAILDLAMDQARLEATPVNEFVDRFVI